MHRLTRQLVGAALQGLDGLGVAFPSRRLTGQVLECLGQPAPFRLEVRPPAP